MKKTPIDNTIKEIQKMDWEFASMLMFFGELFVAMDDTTDAAVVYTKSYFARYYAIDLETFHKWIEFFCPEIWNDNYKRKRKFNFEEAKYIFNQLGKINNKVFPPSFHFDLMKEIYKDKGWKKSRCYEEFNFELSNRFPDRVFNLNKIPPKLAWQIIAENGGHVSNSTESENDFFKIRMFAFHQVISKYKQFSEHDLEVRKRYLRRWFSKADEESD